MSFEQDLNEQPLAIQLEALDFAELSLSKVLRNIVLGQVIYTKDTPSLFIASVGSGSAAYNDGGAIVKVQLT